MTFKKHHLIASFSLFLISLISFSQTNLLLQKEKVRDKVYDICFTPKGGSLAAAVGGSVVLYDISTGEITREFENIHRKDILTIDISSDSTMIASGGKDSTVIICSLTTGMVIRKLKLHSGIVTQVRFSQDGNYLYSSGSDGKIILYSIISDGIVFGTKLHSKIITSFDVSNSANILATASSDGKILIINSLTGDIISELSKGNGWLRDIAFSPDGSRLIAGGDKGKIMIWEVEAPAGFKPVIKVKSIKNWIYGVDFFSDNTTYAFCGFDNNFYVNILADKYYFDAGVMVFKVRFKPASGSDIIVAAATFGRGVILKNASDMKLEK
jgi:WD40 repeat protein